MENQIVKLILSLVVLTSLVVGPPASAAPATADAAAAEAALLPRAFFDQPVETGKKNQCQDTFFTAVYSTSGSACPDLCATACADQGGELESSYWGGGTRDPFCYCTCCRD